MFVFLFCQTLKSQTREIDSLSRLVSAAKEDTNKVKALVMLSFKLMMTGEYVQSFGTTEQIINLSEKLNFKLGLANAYATRGLLYQYQGDYPKALKNLLQSLEIFDAIKSKKGISYSMNNIGSIYVDMKDYTKALEYFDKALELKKSLNDKKGIASTYNNIGIIFQEKATANPNGPSFHNDALMALKYFSSASEIYKSMDYIEENAYLESNIGLIYLMQNKNDLAKAYIDRSLKVFEEGEAKDGIASSHINLGALAVKLGQMEIAKKHYETALSISTNIGNYTATKDCYEGLYKFYLKQNDCKLALFNYQLFINYRDSLLNQENTKKVVQAQMNYEFEKKVQFAKLEQEKKDIIAREEKQKQVYIRNLLIGGFLALLLLAVFIYRSYRNKQKSNIQLENMNKIIVEKNKDITDSINYASRIQNTLLAHDSYLKKHLPGHFVLFKPKDIVSGDFYWATAPKDGKNLFYLAVCDSTGHGVPGAFMSLLNISFLNEAINEKGITEPGEILNYVRKRLIKNISQDGGQDGMDGIILCFNNNTGEISYAAANCNPVLISNKTLTELYCDRMPVGKSDKEEGFKTNIIPAKKDDMLYLYTDGYADQFGGLKGKKFKYKALNELLIKISVEKNETQEKLLSTEFDSWRGSLEQVDDICVIGIKIV